MIELEMLSAVWGLDLLQLYISRKTIALLTDHQALESQIESTISDKSYSARLSKMFELIGTHLYEAKEKHPWRTPSFT